MTRHSQAFFDYLEKCLFKTIGFEGSHSNINFNKKLLNFRQFYRVLFEIEKFSVSRFFYEWDKKCLSL